MSTIEVMCRWTELVCDVGANIGCDGVTWRVVMVSVMVMVRVVLMMVVMVVVVVNVDVNDGVLMMIVSVMAMVAASAMDRGGCDCGGGGEHGAKVPVIELEGTLLCVNLQEQGFALVLAQCNQVSLSIRWKNLTSV